MFEQNFLPLSADMPHLGQIALIPWDIETFGFGVADYCSDTLSVESTNLNHLRSLLQAWAETHGVELIGTTVPASDIDRIYFLQSIGFCYVDTTLVVRYEGIFSALYPSSKVSLVPADQHDLKQVIEIAGDAFNHGRYHADPRFPRRLANKRYQQWVARSFLPQSLQHLFVIKIENQVCAFSVLQTKASQGHLHLNAVAPDRQGKHLGKELITESLRYFQQQGLDLAVSKISAANVPALNLHASLGAKLTDPQILLHCHAPRAKHLIPMSKKTNKKQTEE